MQISNQPHKESAETLVWIAGTWGSDDTLTRNASTLKGNRLHLATQEFFNKTGLDTIEGLTDEQYWKLHDIINDWYEGQAMDAYFQMVGHD